MNNRILEIAHQVLPREDHLIETDVKEYAYFFSSHELQQFAELIVKECVDIACNYDKPKLSGPGLAIACNIESHFDVYTEEDGRFVK
jgi:hypothetical protein